MTEKVETGWYFLLRRLHSLTGIVPIGGFLLFHFFENASARHGAEAFNQTVLKISEMPYIYVMEVAVLLLPILFHAVFGLFITASSRPNVANYGYARNWAYFFQRVSGIIAFAYIAVHVLTTRAWALFIKGSAITFADMQSMLNRPAVLSLYVLGIIAVTYHFSNGLWSFSITWGLVRTAEGQRRLAAATMGLFAILCAVGLDILSAFVLNQSMFARLASIFLGA
ncbi:MAG: succinate dehydrogenase [Oligoflexia bacterium]|nr:succinate dehydrogenase [Oligoflexia bacterium]